MLRIHFNRNEPHPDRRTSRTTQERGNIFILFIVIRASSRYFRYYRCCAFFQVEPQAVEMDRQAAEVERRKVKVNHRAAKTAIKLKQQRRWIFICDVLLYCLFNVQTLLYLFILLYLITVQSGVCQV